jgi:hypothetical protein
MLAVASVTDRHFGDTPRKLALHYDLRRRSY